MWKRFKNWLILKLGGYVSPPPSELIVNHYIKEPKEINTSLRIDNRTLRNYPEMVDDLKNKAVHELAQMLREYGLIEQQIETQGEFDGQRIRLSVRVIEPINPLESSIQHNEDEWNKNFENPVNNYFRKETLYDEHPI